MEAISLSPEQRIRMNAGAAKGLAQIIMSQFAILVVVTLLAGLIGGFDSLWSAFAGGMVYLIPSALIVMQMLMRLYAGANASVASFFIGEAVKIGGSIVLMGLLVRFAGDAIVWPALLIGLVAVLKAYVLLIIFKKI